MIIRELQDFSRSPKPNVRQVTIDLLLSFCKQSKGAYQENIDDLLRISITLFSDENEQIVNTAWDCVDVIIKVKLKKMKEKNKKRSFCFVLLRIWIH